MQTAKWLQKTGVNAKIYLSLKWVNGELLVFDNQSSNALFLHGEEITALLENYKIPNIQATDNGELYLEGNTINVLLQKIPMYVKHHSYFYKTDRLSVS